MQVQTQALEGEGEIENEKEQEAIKILADLPAKKMIKSTPKGGILKKSRKTRKLPPQEGAFIHVNHRDPAFIIAMANQMRLFMEHEAGEDPDIVDVVTGDRVRVLPSKEEVKKLDRIKRQIYRNTPKAIEQREKTNKDPKVIAARKAYASQPEVKERKKVRAKVRRTTARKIKENDPETYSLYEQQAINSDGEDD